MPDDNQKQPGTPASQSQGDSDLAKKIVALEATLADVTKSLKIVTDTMAAQKPIDPEAIKASAKAEAKAIIDGDKKDRLKAELRTKVIGAKLGDLSAKLPELIATAPDTDDEAALNAWADGLAAKVNAAFPANVGGGAKGGGEGKGEAAEQMDGISRFARGIKVA
jgi:hypothetical protein